MLENTPAAIDGAGDAPPPQPQTPEEAELHRAPPGDDDRGAGGRSGGGGTRCRARGAPRQGTLERVPLPWFLKQRFMNAFLRDVHHYLFDVEYGPPGRASRCTSSRRFGSGSSRRSCAPAVTRPHVVVSHSMGTVIAYDCLKRVDGCAAVDGLITIGSPLGLDEIQDKLRQAGPARTGSRPRR